MNKLISILFVPILATLLSCNHTDEPSLDEDGLSQTTWIGTDIAYENDEEIASTPFIVNFLTSTNGKYIFIDDNGNPYGDGEFRYSIVGNMIRFSGAIEGEWTILEYNRDNLVLRAFRPTLHIMTLERM